MARFGTGIFDSDDSADLLNEELSRLVRKFTVSLIQARDYRLWPDHALVYGKLLEAAAPLSSYPITSRELCSFWKLVMTELLEELGYQVGGDEVSHIDLLLEKLTELTSGDDQDRQWIPVSVLTERWMAEERSES